MQQSIQRPLTKAISRGCRLQNHGPDRKDGSGHQEHHYLEGIDKDSHGILCVCCQQVSLLHLAKMGLLSSDLQL